MEKVVSVNQLIKDLKLEVMTGDIGIEQEILISEVYRPGVELTGFLVENEMDIENRIHILSKEELKYLYSLPENIREYNLTHYLSYEFPCLIVTGESEVYDDFLDIAKITDKPILFTEMSFEAFYMRLKSYLERELAPEIVLNNFTLLEIYGMGILLIGDEDSKVGTTIELLEKGHRFITDELLIIQRISDDTILGENGYNQNRVDYNYHLKIDSENKINVIDYFGIGATRRSKKIDIVVKLEKWKENKFYDRLGLEQETQYILGIEVPKLTIPVRKGRNLAIIIETAAMNERLKNSGANSAIYFLEKTQDLINQNAKRRSEDKMSVLKHLTMKQLINRFDLDILSGEEFVNEKKVFVPGFHRPSLEFAGFYEILEEGGKNKIQIIGESEIKYIDKMTKEARDRNIRKYADYDFPCIILTGVKNAPEYFMELMKSNNHLLLTTESQTSSFSHDLSEFMERFFAPTITMHGVLVEVFGFGVLLTGKSGIGKSETALELIHRGHRLIADDMVRFTKMVDGRILGTADKIPYFMEIRGIGIIDVKTLYGLGSVRNSKQLDVVIEMNEIRDDEYLTKADYEEEEVDVLDLKVPKVKLHISSGRNAASMVEIATMNLRAKKVGYDSNEIYLKNFENIKRIANKKENIFMNIGNLITGRKK